MLTLTSIQYRFKIPIQLPWLLVAEFASAEAFMIYQRACPSFAIGTSNKMSCKLCPDSVAPHKMMRRYANCSAKACHEAQEEAAGKSKLCLMTIPN